AAHSCEGGPRHSHRVLPVSSPDLGPRRTDSRIRPSHLIAGSQPSPSAPGRVTRHPDVGRLLARSSIEACQPTSRNGFRVRDSLTAKSPRALGETAHARAEAT